MAPSWLWESADKWAREAESDHLLESEFFDGSTDLAVGSPSPFPESPEAEPPDDLTRMNDANEHNTEEDDELLEDDADVELNDIDWGSAEAEINAFLEETDDEDEGTSLISSRDEISDAESNHESGKKRPRSSPSSSSFSSSSTSPKLARSRSAAESPLAKRRKMAAARAGKSKLKQSESLNTDEAASHDIKTVSSSSNSQSSSPTLLSKDGDDVVTSDEDDLDEFAKALEGELS